MERSKYDTFAPGKMSIKLCCKVSKKVDFPLPKQSPYKTITIVGNNKTLARSQITFNGEILITAPSYRRSTSFIGYVYHQKQRLMLYNAKTLHLNGQYYGTKHTQTSSEHVWLTPEQLIQFFVAAALCVSSSLPCYS